MKHIFFSFFFLPISSNIRAPMYEKMFMNAFNLHVLYSKEGTSKRPHRGGMFSAYILQFRLVKLLCVVCAVCECQLHCLRIWGSRPVC